MEKTLLSFIIATYNDGNYIDRCLKSIITHMPYNSEIIIIDDGSTDNTATVCKRYCALNDSIRYFYQSNSGVSVARNRGIRESKASYVTFIDADDIVVSSIPTSKLQFWDIVLFNYYKNSLDNEIKLFDCKINKNTVIKKYINSDELNTAWAKVYNRKYLLNNSLLFPVGVKVGEDAFFFGKCLETTSKITFVDYSFYLYSYNVNSVSHSPTSTFEDYEVLYELKFSLTKRFFPYLEDKLILKVFGTFISALRSNTFNYSAYLKLLHETKKISILRGLIPLKNNKWPLRRRVQLHFLRKHYFRLLYFELKLENIVLRQKKIGAHVKL